MHYTNKGETPMLTIDKVRSMTPDQISKSTCSKEVFFALTPLAEMTAEGAAEATYSRWIVSGRVKEQNEVKESITGLEPDETVVKIPLRYINAEWRRYHNNARTLEAHRAQGYDSRPLMDRR